MDEKISPEVKKILMDWQARGVKFCFEGKVNQVVMNFAFPASYYSIANQALPKAFHNTKGLMQLKAINVAMVSETGLNLKNAQDDTPYDQISIMEQPIPAALTGQAESFLSGPAGDQNPRNYKVESDPLGKSANEPGAKLDAGKNRVALVMRGFSRALTEVGRVGTYGANKYSPNGWKEVPNGIERYDDAMMRHWLEGRTVDTETGLLHAAQVAWNALAVLELMLIEEED